MPDLGNEVSRRAIVSSEPDGVEEGKRVKLFDGMARPAPVTTQGTMASSASPVVSLGLRSRRRVSKTSVTPLRDWRLPTCSAWGPALAIF